MSLIKIKRNIDQKIMILINYILFIIWISKRFHKGLFLDVKRTKTDFAWQVGKIKYYYVRETARPSFLVNEIRICILFVLISYIITIFKKNKKYLNKSLAIMAPLFVLSIIILNNIDFVRISEQFCFWVLDMLQKFQIVYTSITIFALIILS